MTHPYKSMPPRAFWRSATAPNEAGLIPGLYAPRLTITKHTAVATAGSCFAQHIARALRNADCNLLDTEPPLRRMPPDLAARFGYGLFSARYGNIYTPRQLLELLHDAQAGVVDPALVWERDGRFYDALRPAVEPQGLETAEDVLTHRHFHLDRVMQMITQADLFVFTLGLTEAWVDLTTGRTLPVCPGVIAGEFDPARYQLKCFTYDEVLDDLIQIRKILREVRPEIRMLLTLSPVPLTATARPDHVLTASMAAKATLRAAIDAFVLTHEDADYFPSYEIVTSPVCGGPWFEPNGRDIRPDGVDRVMQYFFDAHDIDRQVSAAKDHDDDPVCEDILLQAFAP